MKSTGQKIPWCTMLHKEAMLMYKAVLVMSLVFVVLVLKGCFEAEYPKKEEPTGIEQSQEEASSSYPNRYNSDQDVGIINTADYFKVHGEIRDPFSHNEQVLLYNDLGLNNADDIIAALGDPVFMEEDEGIGGYAFLRLDYDQDLFVIDETSQVIVEYKIQSEEIQGPRGIGIGDSAPAVIGSFYYEDEIMINKPDIFADLARENEYFACLYYLELDSKVGLVFFDKESESINRIMYAIHYGPHCGVSWLCFECKDGQVSSIWFNLGF